MYEPVCQPVYFIILLSWRTLSYWLLLAHLQHTCKYVRTAAPPPPPPHTHTLSLSLSLSLPHLAFFPLACMLSLLIG